MAVTPVAQTTRFSPQADASESSGATATPAPAHQPATPPPHARETGLTVLVVGSGGREHALVRACLRSPKVSSVVAAPGNAGMASEVTCRAVLPNNPPAVVALATELKADLVVIGPEEPLAAGVADALRAAGFTVYGPNRDGAQLEASKAAAKTFMERHGIPTAAAATFTEVAPALAYLATQPVPVVIKASGLAAGKGVVVCEDRPTAERVVQEMLSGERHGASGGCILVESFLDGEEASIMLMLSGKHALMLPASQDHKRLLDGDRGPNTGGMGAYAPAPCVTPEVEAKVRQRIIEPVLSGLAAEGIDYRGTLYVGIMIVQGDPFVIEFNARFGDPECQVLLPLLAEDPVDYLLACARGEPLPSVAPTTGQHAMVVVLAADGYPDKPSLGEAIPAPIKLGSPGDYPGTSITTAKMRLHDRSGWPTAEICYAGVKLSPSVDPAADTAQLPPLVTAGGRVLGAVGLGSTLAEARERAYALAEAVTWPSAQWRRDIGWRALRPRHPDGSLAEP